jgi:beta-1,4-mannosyl-glycoprotein beta-1,4-N-acetylglucosaminyltransferase
MIVDSFLFGWELEILEMRLMEMDPFVDVFVLIEADKTFQGEPKPFYYEENKQLFDRWSHKILSVKAQLPDSDDPWAKEHASREALRAVISEFPQEAIIMHGDVDELVSRQLGANLHYILDRDKVYALDQVQYSMAVDWLYPMSWQGTVIARRNIIDSMSMLDVRSHRIYGNKIRDGWHFTWLGGPEAIARKASSFSHTEDEIQNYIRDVGGRLYSEGYHVRGEKLIPVDVDESYPAYIQQGLCPSSWYRPR